LRLFVSFSLTPLQSTLFPIRNGWGEGEMDVFLNMSPVQAAALQIGLLIVLMLGLKLYVGNRRARLKVPSGDVTNAEFGRATRIQLNAVEDVPVLMIGIAALAALGMSAWYIHLAGLVLLVSRIAHAVGLAGSSGFSIGRLVGTLGTLLVYLGVAGPLIVHAFAP
jgi:uncharacterized membrane protein YecN with MAPEG domain